jgi:glycerophosphoryl diester phosphodiesterase
MLTCFAHRGASGHAPENTLLAFEKAIGLGCQWIELDVRCSADGRAMVIHDECLDRTTTGCGRISDHTFDYLRSFDAGKGERIPTLREVLEVAGGRVGINIEIKVREAIRPSVHLIRDYVSSGKMSYEQVLISSFDLPALALVKGYDSRIPLGALFFGIPLRMAANAVELGCRSVHAALEYTTRDTVAEIHSCGLRYYVYTVNNVQELNRAKALEVDGIFSNYPEICRDVL